MQRRTKIFEQFARSGKALSSGQRLELQEFLAKGERSVEARWRKQNRVGQRKQ